MKCPACLLRMKCIETYHQKKRNQTRRRYECLECGHRLTTLEMSVSEVPTDDDVKNMRAAQKTKDLMQTFFASTMTKGVKNATNNGELRSSRTAAGDDNESDER